MKKIHLVTVLMLFLLIGLTSCRTQKEGCYYGNFHLKAGEGNLAVNQQHCKI